MISEPIRQDRCFSPIAVSRAEEPPPDGHHGDQDLQNWSSLIGIITAICGNILIALALNVQRYAHIRLHRKRAQIRERAKQAMKNAAGTQGSPAAGYGSNNASEGANGTTGDLSTLRRNGRNSVDSDETEPLAQSFRSGDSRWTECSSDEDTKVASTYLQDPYWWLGQVLITVGEMGNFLAYGFAPASIVSPLGVVALVSNCVIAPIFFKEVFRRRDFFGVIVAVGGAVTVVLSAKQEETKLGPHEVWGAITTMEFEIYMAVSCALIALLMWLSPRYGNRTILIDLGLVGLFGGYTALSTKGVSSMLSSTLLGAFTTPVTYVLLFVLLSTAVMQVRYVNKALQRFDSTQVIPIQFVLFTLSVITGSAVLYRDFERTTKEQAVKFVWGCLLTFFGVFLITSGRPRQDTEEDTLSDVEGIEETIGLSEQEPTTSRTPIQQSRRGSESARSRRSSRASGVSYKEAVNRPLSLVAGRGYPSKRPPAGPPASRPVLFEDEGEDTPLLGSTWRESLDQPYQQAKIPPHTTSSDSLVSTAVSDSLLPPEYEEDTPSGASTRPTVHIPPSNAPAILEPSTPPTERPATPPRAPPSASRPHSHHFGGAMISPSPFSSTVSAVVADKILAHLDPSASPTARRSLASRRSRPGLRNSLFVPQDEVTDDETDEDEEEGDLTRARSALEPRHSPHSGASTSRLGESVFPRDQGLRGGGPRPKEGRGFRGRARSLSHSLGEFFGVGGGSTGKRRNRRNTATIGGGTTSDFEDDRIATAATTPTSRGVGLGDMIRSTTEPSGPIPGMLRGHLG
ncbi:Magnesium transporter NIPA domain containing protein [Naviculisporaceae sp. PSN 640]